MPDPHPDTFVACRKCGFTTTIYADVGRCERDGCDGVPPGLAEIVGRPASWFIQHEHDHELGPVAHAS